MSDLVYEFNIESNKEKDFGGANAAIENLIRHQLMDLLDLIVLTEDGKEVFPTEFTFQNEFFTTDKKGNSGPQLHKIFLEKE